MERPTSAGPEGTITPQPYSWYKPCTWSETAKNRLFIGGLGFVVLAALHGTMEWAKRFKKIDPATASQRLLMVDMVVIGTLLIQYRNIQRDPRTTP